MSSARPEMSYLHPARISPITLSVQAVLITYLDFEPESYGLSTYSQPSLPFRTGIFSAQAERGHGLVLAGQAQVAGLEKVHPATQRFPGGLPGEFRVVIVLG